METDQKAVPQYLSDFSSNGETPKEQLALKSAFINAYGLEKFEDLISRSIRKASAAKTAR